MRVLNRIDAVEKRQDFGDIAFKVPSDASSRLFTDNLYELTLYS